MTPDELKAALEAFAARCDRELDGAKARYTAEADRIQARKRAALTALRKWDATTADTIAALIAAGVDIQCQS